MEYIINRTTAKDRPTNVKAMKARRQRCEGIRYLLREREWQMEYIVVGITTMDTCSQCQTVVEARFFERR